MTARVDTVAKMHKKKVFAADAVVKVHDALRKKFREAGRGAQRRTEEELGLYRNYFADKKKQKVLDLGALLLALDKLKVHPGEVFEDAFGRIPRKTFTERIPGSDKLSKSTELLIGNVRARLAEESITPRSAKDDINWLKKLDRLLDDDPHLVILKINEKINSIHKSTLLSALGVYGTACMVAEQICSAQDSLEAALETALLLNEPQKAGDLLRRLSYLAGRLGNRARALSLAKEATQQYVLTDDREGASRSIVDQGIHLFYLKQHSESIKKLEVSLGRLKSPRYRAAALHTLGLIYLEMEDFKRSRYYAAETRKLRNHMGAIEQARIVWLEGAIAAKMKNLKRAKDLLWEAAERFYPVSSLDSALVSVQVIEIQIDLGLTEEASKTAKSMARLISPLKDYRAAQAAITELIRRGLEGDITTSLLRRAGESISNDQQRSKQGAAAEGLRGRREERRPHLKLMVKS